MNREGRLRIVCPNSANKAEAIRRYTIVFACHHAPEEFGAHMPKEVVGEPELTRFLKDHVGVAAEELMPALRELRDKGYVELRNTVLSDEKLTELGLQ
jgi:hypothetical protein